MRATEPTGFLYLNAANVWPSFVFQDVAPDATGALQLTPSAPAGVFMGGPFEALDGNTPWYRFSVDAELPNGSHLQFFSWVGGSGTPPFAPTSIDPFPGWKPVPRDALAGVLFQPDARQIWVGAVLRSDGSSTPSVRQIRLDYGRDTYLKHLPAIYRADPDSRDLLERFLSLTETALGGLRQEIRDLSLLFDPAAAPTAGYPSWFAWLSSWLAWQLNRNWSEEQAREYLAGAFELYALRGTVEGLRRYLKIYAGVNAHIWEPAQHTTVWSLGTNSTLGLTTMLAPASAAGAILDSTSVLDASNLTAPNDPFGANLYDDVAYRFCVGINAAELTQPGALSAARSVIDREKPAHTVAHLCVIPARMRIGVQSRIGIDSIIGAPAEAIIGQRLDGAVLGHAKEISHAH